MLPLCQEASGPSEDILSKKTQAAAMLADWLHASQAAGASQDIK